MYYDDHYCELFRALRQQFIDEIALKLHETHGGNRHHSIFKQIYRSARLSSGRDST